MQPDTAIVVGSGPNGLAAAIAMAQAGVRVQVLEAAPELGGGARSGELTLPGFTHDLGSAVHPLAVASPFFSTLDLPAHGVNWIWSPAELAHPFDDGTAVLVSRSVVDTAAELGGDATAYRQIFEPIARDWTSLLEDLLQPPLHWPRHMKLLARFGYEAVQPASLLIRSRFQESRGRGLMAGFAAHSVLKLSAPLSASFGLVIGGSAHTAGWPIPMGGAQQIANSLARILAEAGGSLECNRPVTDWQQIASAGLRLLDISPRQLAKLSGAPLPSGFRRSLNRYRYGPGVFKVDWALSQPIPWKARECAQATTVHLGAEIGEIERSESDCWEGKPPSKPFVLLAQPSLFDPTRAPAGKHTAWAYCHVPQGWTGSALEAIEAQVERFAPGFRDCILARNAHNTKQMEGWNANLVGGDITGGPATLRQFLFRPTWRGYRTPLPGTYLCSSSTAPGGGVHGMCGANAAAIALAASRKRA